MIDRKQYMKDLCDKNLGRPVLEAVKRNRMCREVGCKKPVEPTSYYHCTEHHPRNEEDGIMVYSISDYLTYDRGGL